ncbi:hypothetical protein [Marinitoga lauensis]|uniref:hypothetical protein n=1 Tax=Marinitoga lauensis TaxID=2201189 RepID=UPI001404FD9B|nr:hypothetical protein [Marinitoga lauensis]
MDEYEKMKKKMDIDESEPIEPISVSSNQSIETNTETNLEEIDVNSLLDEPLPEETKDINMDIEDVLEDNNVEEKISSENIEELSDNETENIDEENNENNEDNEDNNIESFIEKKK